MSAVSERDKAMAHALAELGRACHLLSAAFLTGDSQAEVDAALAKMRVSERAPAAQPKPEARSPKQKPLAVGQEAAMLGKTDRRVLLALAQLGRPLNMDEVAFFVGASRTSGGLGQALADLRREGLISGPGSAIEITTAGRVELGEFTPLPIGHELFAYWCGKLGAAPEKILRALHKARSTLNMDQLAEATGFSRTSGGLGQALADLRKMRLIDGPGSAMQLSADFKRAIEPTISVFDRSSGHEHRITPKGHAR